MALQPFESGGWPGIGTIDADSPIAETSHPFHFQEFFFMGPILLIILVLLLLGSIPVWPYSHNWGYYPGGGLGLVLLIVLLLVLFGRI